MNKRIETPHFAASCHAAYFARYIAMAAGIRSEGSESQALERMAVEELTKAADLLGLDVVRRTP